MQKITRYQHFDILYYVIHSVWDMYVVKTDNYYNNKLGCIIKMQKKKTNKKRV